MSSVFSDTAEGRFALHKPTVSLDVISLVASSCGYYRGQIEHRVAHAFAVHLATQRGLAKRRQHRHPPHAQPVAPMREHHCRRPRLPPRSCTDQAPSRDQRQSGGTHGRSNAPIASPCLVRRCPPFSPLFASWPWLLHTGCSLEALDRTVHERNRSRRYCRFKDSDGTGGPIAGIASTAYDAVSALDRSDSFHASPAMTSSQRWTRWKRPSDMARR
jgi:hypothetical protein